MTLRDIIEQHPEWADLPVAVYRIDGSLDYIGASGMVYLGEDYENEDEPTDVLVFSGN